MTCMATITCGAKTRSGTPCKHPAGYGTPHLGTGRCKYHGGCSTGPRDPEKMIGNKRALTTGEREAVWLDVLPTDEQQIYHDINTDKLRQIDEEIRLTTIRERRMLQRIENLKAHSFTLVEYTETIGEEKGNDVLLLAEKKQATLGQIQHIEEALTRVQAHKARLIRDKHDIEVQIEEAKKGQGGAAKSAIAALMERMRQDEAREADVGGDTGTPQR